LASIIINKEKETISKKDFWRNLKKYYKISQNEENEDNKEKESDKDNNENEKDDDYKEIEKMIQKYLEKDQKNEDKENKISKWSKDEIIVAILTLLAGANVEILTILESKIQIFGLNFNNKLSPAALKVMNWGAWFNFVGEDIPQVTIQACNFFTLLVFFFFY